MTFLARFFPLAAQLEGYDRSTFRSDLSAGLTVGVMLIPQGMAYALIAGMPPIYGLYASLVPLVIYGLVGSSRQLAVGPVAIVSLLVAAGVAPLAAGDPERYVALALLLALMVGVLQLGMGLLRFGFLTNFLSHPVLAGFTSAAAIVIGASQLKHLVGVDLPGTNQVLELGFALAARWQEVHVPTLLLGVVAIGLLVVLKRWRKAFPGALLVVAISTAAVAFLGWQDAGIRVVGQIPGGLPAPTLPFGGTPGAEGPAALVDLGAMWQLLPVALTIALVGFMESIAVAKVYATRHRYPLDANRELVGLGLANIVGSFFRAFPTTGGFSRTAVNDQAGARTTVATLIAAGIIGLTLLFLTGLFRTLPNAVLAAIVMVAVANLVNWKEAVHLWHADRRDLALMGVTFVATLFVGIEEGIIVGVLASLAALVYESSRPHVAVCGQLPDSDTWLNIRHHPEAEETPGVVVFRIDSGLSFANAEYVRERVQLLAVTEPTPRDLVFDFHAVNGVDSTSLHQLGEILTDLEQSGIEPWFAGVKWPIMERLRRVGFDERVGAERFFHEVGTAVRAARSHRGHGAPGVPGVPGEPEGAQDHGEASPPESDPADQDPARQAEVEAGVP
ncbi:MAG: solute carrier 26 family protein [Gemmatimonadales bacterium]|nr:MAG: solute carrier 26 family protein [Gemmatimonadales bacterium]